MINRKAIEQRAREDAKLGIYQPDDYVVATQGPEPVFDPVANLEHSTVGSRLQDPTIAELQEDIRHDEDELARHPSPQLLGTFLLLLLVLEAAGAIYIMKTLGIENPERIVFGSALAVCVFFTAWLASRTGNRALSIAALVALGVLVSALSVIRVDDNAAEGGSRAVNWASAVILAAVTVGPALMAEHILRLLAPTLPVVRRVWQLRRRIASSTGSRSGATRFVTRVAKRRDRWQREAARRRAIYDVAYRAARAELGGESRPGESSTALELVSRFPPQPSNQPDHQ
jgi:hypothetical protein